MKRSIGLCFTILLASYSNAQNGIDYSLKGLSKICSNCTNISPFHEGVALIEKDEKKGVIDKMGNFVVPIDEYDDISNFTNGTAYVHKGEKVGEIDSKGKVVTPLHNISEDLVVVDSIIGDEPVYNYSEGLAVILKNDKYGYIDEKGTIVISPKYEEARDFHDGIAVVCVGYELYGFIDKSGREIMPCNLFEVRDFSEGLAIVRKEMGSQYSFYNTKGEKEFTTEFRSCRSFKEGIAVVGNEEGKMGFINHSGEMVIPYNYDYVDDFSEGLAIVMKEGKLGYIDKDGRCSLDF